MRGDERVARSRAIAFKIPFGVGFRIEFMMMILISAVARASKARSGAALFLFCLLSILAAPVHGQTEARAADKNARLILCVDPVAPAKFAPMLVGGVFDPSIRGVWRVRGYGFVFEISKDRLRWFSEVAGLAWEHELGGPFDMLFAIDAASGRCYVKPFPTEGAYILERLPKLPAKCETLCTKTDAKTTLELIDRTMSEYYAFFRERRIDWAARVAHAEKRVDAKTSDEAFVAVLEDLFKGLNDGHTSVNARVGDKAVTVSSGRSSLKRALIAAHERQRDGKTFRAFMQSWGKRFKASIKDDLLRGKAQTAFDETLIWGRVEDQIGYLFIKDMYNYIEDDRVIGGLRRLHDCLARIFEGFTDCEAVILDVSVNTGGMHSFAFAFASHIADRRRYALAKYPIGSPDLLQKFDVLPYRDRAGRQKTYTKPVFVLTTDATVSAGEEFALAARVFPHVRIVGGRSFGMLSDMLEKPLPNGWTLNLSNEIFLDADGKCYEAEGIPVSQELEIFDLKNVERIGHTDSIRRFARSISRKDR